MISFATIISTTAAGCLEQLDIGIMNEDIIAAIVSSVEFDVEHTG